MKTKREQNYDLIFGALRISEEHEKQRFYSMSDEELDRWAWDCI